MHEQIHGLFVVSNHYQQLIIIPTWQGMIWWDKQCQAMTLGIIN
jgi:hypothetical protein